MFLCTDLVLRQSDMHKSELIKQIHEMLNDQRTKRSQPCGDSSVSPNGES